VTAVIAAHNEAGQIADCVRSASWAAEVLVVENDSTDDTIALARSAGATVFSHPFRSIGAQRNAAIARAIHPWIFVLDADERATPALGAEVARRIGEATTDAWRVRRRNWFLGREIRHSGWDRDRPVRLFRSSLRYDERPVHEHVMTTTDPGVLDESLHHRPYANLDEYFEKLGRYSRDWAAQHHASGRRASVFTLLIRPQARFISTLLWRGGWRDGWQGVVISALAAVSVASKYAHLWTLRHQGRPGGDPWPT
jgi:glycosyltransferase involved in cell wall biosynthesis